MNKMNRMNRMNRNLLNFIRLNKIKKLVKFYDIVKKRNMYNPNLHNKKFLTIVATHVNNKFKYNNLLNTVNYISFDCNDIVIVNSTNLVLNTNVQDFCSTRNIKYFEVENDSTYDFGKWIYVLQNVDLSKYDFIVFTNDSFIIYKPIHHFYNLTVKRNVELYGYNDSTQNGYHYQSYLFSLRKDVIQKFINIFYSKKNNIKGQSDVINQYELKLTQIFNTNDCFLKIGNEFYHKNQNIFFTSDELYYSLFINKLLPFVKIKRIT